MDVIASLKERLHKHHEHEQGYLQKFKLLEARCQASEDTSKAAQLDAAAKHAKLNADLQRTQDQLQRARDQLQHHKQQAEETAATTARLKRKISSQAKSFAHELRKARDTMGAAEIKLKTTVATSSASSRMFESERAALCDARDVALRQAQEASATLARERDDWAATRSNMELRLATAQSEAAAAKAEAAAAAEAQHRSRLELEEVKRVTDVTVRSAADMAQHEATVRVPDGCKPACVCVCVCVPVGWMRGLRGLMGWVGGCLSHNGRPNSDSGYELRAGSQEKLAHVQGTVVALKQRVRDMRGREADLLHRESAMLEEHQELLNQLARLKVWSQTISFPDTVCVRTP